MSNDCNIGCGPRAVDPLAGRLVQIFTDVGFAVRVLAVDIREECIEIGGAA